MIRSKWLAAILIAVSLALHFAIIAGARGDWVVAGMWLATASTVGGNLFLLTVFARTLAPGREPLVTTIARLVRGAPLDPRMQDYTRSVTFTWSLYFASMAMICLALAAFAPLHVWSLFTNVLVWPAVGLLFMIEYGYRRWRFRNYEHVAPHVMLARLVKAGYFRAVAASK